MTWNVYQSFVTNGSVGIAISKPKVTVRVAATGALASLAKDIDGTPENNPFVGNNGFFRFYVAAGRYEIKVENSLLPAMGSTTYKDVLIGSAAGAELGTASGDVPTIAIADARYVRKALSNYTATSAPTVNDDSDDGYIPGSYWVDNSASPKETYLCIDATVGAAVWLTINLTLDDLGTMASQDADDVTISGGTISGLSSPLAIADGGTGGTTAAAARTALELGSAAQSATGDFATAAQGALADTASQPGQDVSQFANDMGYLTGSSSPVTVTGDITLSDVSHGNRPLIVTAAATITCPADATENFDAGWTCDVMADTAGQVAITGEAGVTIESTTVGPDVAITDQNGWCSIMKIGTNRYSVVGQIEAVSV